MRVEWEMSDRYPQIDAHINFDVRGMVMKVDDIWMAKIYDARGNSGYPVKADNSLLELMAWVEEELKFRWSHNE